MKELIFMCFMLLGICFGTESCKKLDKYKDPDKISKTSWNPNIAVPLAHASFGVYDILAQTDSNDLVIIDPNSGEIALVYKGEVASFRAEDIIEIPDAFTQEDFNMADFGIIAVPSFTNTANVMHTETFDVNPGNGIEFHTVTFKGGALNMQLSTDLRHDLTINIEFPELTKNGVSVNETVNLVYAGSIPQTAQISIDLNGAVGDFTINNTTVNQLEGNYNITMTGTGEAILGTENIQSELEFSNLSYKNATGYFGQQALGGHKDSILLKIFTETTDGYFELTNPKIKLEMLNAFGFPVDVMLSNIKTVNENTGQEFVLTGYPGVVSIASPSGFGEVETTTLELNTTNTTNLSSVITPVPKYFHFEAAGISNPNGPTATLNFIEDTSQFKINAELELPLEGFAYGFTVEDTVEFSFTDDIEEVESILFRFIVDNGFPVDLFTSIVFVDENYVTLHALTNGSEHIVESANVDADGAVTSSVEKVTDFTIDRSSVPSLKSAKYIILKAEAESLNGTSQAVVKFFDFYRISLKLGMQVRGNLNF